MDPLDKEGLDDTLRRRCEGGLWLPLAAMAWRSHLDHGRGVLCGPVGFIQGRRTEMDYVTVSDGSRFPDWLAKAVTEYDPETAIVLLLVADDEFDRLSQQAGAGLESHMMQLHLGQVYCRTLEMEPAPPAAYRSQAS
jgi:hypothetical protein